MKLIAGSSNPGLAQEIAKLLNVTLVDIIIKRFADNEIFVKINEPVRGEDVFVIQSTCFPVNDHLMELLIIIDTLKRASAKSITAVIPYFGYARQDREIAPQTSVSAKLVADILTSAGAGRILTLDLHAAQIQEFFNITVDNLTVISIFEHWLYEHYKDLAPVIAAPDFGGLSRAKALAQKLDLELAILNKCRRKGDGAPGVVEVTGNINKKDCIIIDDIVDSADTLCNAADALLAKNASSVRAFVTHGVLSHGAVEKLKGSALTEVVITDSIVDINKLIYTDKIKLVKVAPLFKEAIRWIAEGKPGYEPF